MLCDFGVELKPLPSRDRTAPKETPKNVKATASYPPLHTALLHRWTGLSKRQTKEVKPAIIFTILGACEIFRVLYMLEFHEIDLQSYLGVSVVTSRKPSKRYSACR